MVKLIDRSRRTLSPFHSSRRLDAARNLVLADARRTTPHCFSSLFPFEQSGVTSSAQVERRGVLQRAFAWVRTFSMSVWKYMRITGERRGMQQSARNLLLFALSCRVLSRLPRHGIPHPWTVHIWWTGKLGGRYNSRN